MKKCPVNISDEAREYLGGLVLEQGDKADGVILFVLNPGTSKAEVCLAFAEHGKTERKVVAYELPMLVLYIEEESHPYLEDASIDFITNDLQKSITIKAPHSRAPRLSENSTIEEKIQYFLATEVNPDLASHGGEVSLEKLENGSAYLRFGGGCQGCSMVDVTLKNGVEKQLLSAFSELHSVVDVTDHEAGTQGYY